MYGMDVKVDMGESDPSVYNTSARTLNTDQPNGSSHLHLERKGEQDHMHHDGFIESRFNTEDNLPNSTVFNPNFQNSPLDLPSLRSSHRDHIPLLQLALKILPRLRSNHRFLLLWIVLHLGLGFLALGLSLFIKSLALSGFGYIVIFDAFGLFNILVSETLSSFCDISDPSSAYPFGLKRFEVVFGLVNILYVLFAAVNLIKEGVEGLLLGEAPDPTPVAPPFAGFGPLSGAVVLLCCVMTFITAISYRNHWQLSLLRFRKQTSHPVVYAFWSQILNPFVLSTLVFGVLTVSLLFNATFGLSQEVLDSVISLFQAGIIFYLSVPLALTLSMILLQSTPPEIDEPLRQVMVEVCSLPYVDRCQNFHIWQTTYGEYVGSLQVVLNKSETSTSYRDILTSVQAPWRKILQHCTVQVVHQDEA
ncbi:hypothetical protein DSO57_1029941 [Entomophthora muscae]|uniref:Uncharacterized protein n=1 Tax=Entomophthora muscae TaxID=34485 RepID=A0ACC2T204_9FUNG|nr:hypothetical protein DSO57_1029941 [Entomophthora muscae]